MYDPVAMTLAINEDFLRTEVLDIALDVDVPGRKVITRVDAGLPGAVKMQTSIAIDVPAFHAHLMNTITGTPASE
jgi:inosine-uridine nucleoside N-ribohydrolase